MGLSIGRDSAPGRGDSALGTTREQSAREGERVIRRERNGQQAWLAFGFGKVSSLPSSRSRQAKSFSITNSN